MAAVRPILGAKSAKSAYSFFSSLSHSETNWDIAMMMGALTAAMIWLLCLKIW